MELTDEEPLDREWASVCPLISSCSKAPNGSIGKQLPNHNTEIDPRRRNTAEPDRRHLGFLVATFNADEGTHFGAIHRAHG